VVAAILVAAAALTVVLDQLKPPIMSAFGIEAGQSARRSALPRGGSTRVEHGLIRGASKKE
jgi:hypothetical protein